MKEYKIGLDRLEVTSFSFKELRESREAGQGYVEQDLTLLDGFECEEVMVNDEKAVRIESTWFIYNNTFFGEREKPDSVKPVFESKMELKLSSLVYNEPHEKVVFEQVVYSKQYENHCKTALSVFAQKVLKNFLSDTSLSGMYLPYPNTDLTISKK